MPPPSARQRPPENASCPAGCDLLLPRMNVADTSALGEADRAPSVGEARQI